VGHLRANGFKVKIEDHNDLGPIKARYGVPRSLEGCHTALVDGYVVEGHVQATTIRRLLRERPAVAGIAVPGMPAGSPGMETGGRPERYNVLTFDRSGKTTIYESH